MVESINGRLSLHWQKSRSKMGRHDDRSVSQSQRDLSCLSREDQEKIVSGNAANVFHVG
jgi:hypothetical protein